MVNLRSLNHALDACHIYQKMYKNVWEINILGANPLIWPCLPEVSCCMYSTLTHWSRVTHICVSKLTIIGSDNGLPSDRRQAIIWTNARLFNWILRNKLQWNLNRKSNIFIQENAFKCVVCKTAAILSRPQWVKQSSGNLYLNLQSSRQNLRFYVS